MTPRITIIGRPNVWKSSFFNLYTWHKIAIIDNISGTTRDISEFEFYDSKNDIKYIIADSWWLDFWSKTDEVSLDIIEKTRESMKSSELLVWVLEYDKFSNLDEKILKVLKKQNFNNYIIVANKADNESFVMESWNISGKWELEFFPVSVSHNSWIDSIKDFISSYLKNNWLSQIDNREEKDFIKLSIIGRPNVGKSSIINTILGKDRLMVKDMAWTTRDSIDSRFVYNDKNFILIDTAWIRRLSKVWVRNVENWSVMRSQRSLKRSDIVWLVIDWFEWIVSQDLSIVNMVLEEKKGLVLIINKWDKVLNKPWINKSSIMNKYIEYLQEKIEFIPWIPIVFTSALDKKRLDEILKRAIEISNERVKRVKTGVLNNFLKKLVYKHPPTWTKKSHSPKIYYVTQADINPPKFVFSVSNPEHFHFSYKRYIENRIRDNFWFSWTPIIIEYRWRWKNKWKIK